MTSKNRTPSGAPSATARDKHGYNGTGEFPIFDAHSATSALQLRSKAHSEAEREWIIRTAKKYAPAAAKAAELEDEKHK